MICSQLPRIRSRQRSSPEAAFLGGRQRARPLSRLAKAAWVRWVTIWGLVVPCVIFDAPAEVLQRFDTAGLLQHLTNEFIPFFLARTPDKDFGGYNVHIDAVGTVHASPSKGIIAQSRQLYMFSVGARRTTGEQRDRYLQAARLGKAFLAEKMHDSGHGGFWERVSRDGYGVADPRKHTYGQAFAIYALTEFARAADDRDALMLAIRTHDIVPGKMWDRERGGLFRTAVADWAIRDDKKKIDDHLHFLEAVWNLSSATKMTTFRDEIGDLSRFLLGTFFSGPRLDERELVYRDLSSAPSSEFLADRTGHSLESAWFLLRAARLLGREEFRRAALTIIDRVVLDSFDRKYGGVVPLALDGERTWWVQCEGVTALALAWKDTGEARYREAFEAALAFTMQAFPDRNTGGWYASVSRAGRNGQGNKAGEWKAGYHETQMLAYVADLLAGQDPDAEP
jgi:cellobiose epimerase